MKNAKLVAWGIIGSLGAAALATITETEALYSIAGIGYVVFGIWAAVILFHAGESSKS